MVFCWYHSGIACTPSSGGGLVLAHCSTGLIRIQEHMHMVYQDQGIVVADDGAKYGR